MVVVSIEDINDNPPKFDKADYSVAVLEHSPGGSFVLQAKVTDEDLVMSWGSFYCNSSSLDWHVLSYHELPWQSASRDITFLCDYNIYYYTILCYCWHWRLSKCLMFDDNISSQAHVIVITKCPCKSPLFLSTYLWSVKPTLLDSWTDLVHFKGRIRWNNPAHSRHRALFSEPRSHHNG